jgi:hypothetical protein
MEKPIRDLFESSNRVTLISEKYDKDFNSVIDMPLERDILCKTFIRFRNFYLSKEIQNKNIVAHSEIEKLMKKTKLDFELTEKQNDCVNALFEMYLYKLITTEDIVKADKYIIDMLNSFD